MQIRSASSSASSRCCELIMIDLPTLSYLMSYHIYCLDSTSSPEVGSSKTSSLGRVTIAIPSESFLFIPPESSFTFLSLCSWSMTTVSVWSIYANFSCSDMFFISQTKFKCSITVKSSKSTSNCWHRPKFYWIVGISVFMLRPYTIASPPSGAWIPVNMLIAVVFPAPLCPRMAKISFYFIDIFRLSTALFSPNYLVRSLNRIGSFGSNIFWSACWLWKGC